MSTSSDSDGSNGRRFFQGSKTYECKICGNEFKSGQSLGGHMNVHRRSSRSSESSCNATSSVESSATYKGVRYRSEQNKWVAEIRPPRSSKTWWLGTYNTAIEAAYAYDVAIVYFNSETSLNFYGHPVYDQIPTISPNLPKEDFAVQLRKVVKKYGRMAMESGPSHEEEASSSISQQEEPSFDDVIDWSVALGGSTECDTSFLDLTPQCDSNFTSDGSYYDPEPANYPTSDHYNYQVSSNYDPSGHYNYEYSYPQQQLWSPSPSYYGDGY